MPSKEDEFVARKIKRSTWDRLRKICPKGVNIQYFASNILDNAMDHREQVEKALSFRM